MLRAKAGLDSAVDGDGAAILDADTGLISALNSTGARVWSGLCRGTPIDEIIATLAEETGEAISIIDPDVRGFVEQLRVEGLIQD